MDCRSAIMDAFNSLPIQLIMQWSHFNMQYIVLSSAVLNMLYLELNCPIYTFENSCVGHMSAWSVSEWESIRDDESDEQLLLLLRWALFLPTGECRQQCVITDTTFINKFAKCLFVTDGHSVVLFMSTTNLFVHSVDLTKQQQLLDTANLNSAWPTWRNKSMPNMDLDKLSLVFHIMNLRYVRRCLYIISRLSLSINH